MQCLLLPYMRVCKTGHPMFEDVRLCILLDKGKFINKPARNKNCEGLFQNLEIVSNLKKVLFGICRGENIQHLS